MIGKIIALVDGSTYSRSVCDHAAWAAGRSGCEVDLMHVLGRREEGASSDLSGVIALGARSALLQDLSNLDEQRAKLAVRRGRTILEDAKGLLDETGIKATRHLRHGDLIEEITEAEKSAEMILIGKRGEAADFAKGHLGSNLERVMRVATKPLFIASRAFRPIEKVLVAYDGGASAMRAVDYMARSPLYADLAIRIVTVGLETEARKTSLSEAKARLAANGLRAETGILAGEPEEMLAKLIEERGFDHLILSASGHSRLRSLFIGSTSLEMIHVCTVPILIVR